MELLLRVPPRPARPARRPGALQRLPGHGVRRPHQRHRARQHGDDRRRRRQRRPAPHPAPARRRGRGRPRARRGRRGLRGDQRHQPGRRARLPAALRRPRRGGRQRRPRARRVRGGAARRSARPPGARPGQLEEPRHRPRRPEGAEHGRQGPPAHDRRPGQERRRRGRAQRRAQGVVAAVHDEPRDVERAARAAAAGHRQGQDGRVPRAVDTAEGGVRGRSARGPLLREGGCGRYVDPSDPAHNEILVANNWAQSNFDSTDLVHGSPAERRTTGFTIANRLPHAATYLTVADLDRALCRIYLGNAWVRLGAGAAATSSWRTSRSRTIPSRGPASRPSSRPSRGGRRRCCRSPRSWCRGRRATPMPAGGVGRQPQPADRPAHPRARRGAVRARGAGHGGVHGGRRGEAGARGRVNVVLWMGERPDRQHLCGDTVNAAGRFDAVVPRDVYDAAQAGRPILGEALYLGAWPWATSRSGTRRLR